jgi:hypothetical protein
VTTTDLHIRWMIRRDFPRVLPLEEQFGTWTEDDFLRCLRQRNCIGMVVEVGEELVGYMVYELLRTRLRTLKLVAVAVEAEAALVAKLAYKVDSHRRRSFSLPVGGRQWTPRLRQSWLSESVRLLLREPTTPAAVVADAVEEAGCTDRVLLAYLRRDDGVAAEFLSLLRLRSRRWF